ncbi:hypothetical protein LTR94_024783, partial [Friedmanniomyces endolithicus]
RVQRHPSRQRDRQLHQGRPEDPGADPARSRPVRQRASGARHVGRGPDRYGEL